MYRLWGDIFLPGNAPQFGFGTPGIYYNTEKDSMEKIKAFIKTSILGGVTVILPATILFIIFRWIFDLITGLIQPLTNLVVSRSHLQEIVADLLVIGIILAVCFMVGVAVKTKVGTFIHGSLEKHILSVAPGYTMIKETVMQFLGKKKAPFSSVVLIQPFDNNTLMTAFVTDSHMDGSYTVFAPTGPNPTSGLIFHLDKHHVHHVSVPVEAALRSVVSCGAGSSRLLDALVKTSVSLE